MCHVAFSFSTQNSLQYAVGLPDSRRNLVLGKPSNVCSVRKILAIVVWSSAVRDCTSWKTTCQSMFPGNDTTILGNRTFLQTIDFHVTNIRNQPIPWYFTSTHFTIRKLQIFHFSKLPCSPFQQSYYYQYLWWTEGASGERKDRNGPLGFPSWRFWTWDETASLHPWKDGKTEGKYRFPSNNFQGLCDGCFSLIWNVPSDKQMSNRWPCSLLNDEQRVATRLGV